MPLPAIQTCSQTVVKEIRPDPDGLYNFVIAINDTDRYGQNVDLSQLDFSRYERNPVVLLGHGYPHREPIGLTHRICNGPAGIEVGFAFAERDPTAERIENLVRQGVQRAASISWYNESGTAYLAEWSIVSIGLDPDALARSGYVAPDDDTSSVERVYISRGTLTPLTTSQMAANDQCTDRTDLQPSTGTDPLPDQNRSSAPANNEPAQDPAPSQVTGELDRINQARADLNADLERLQAERTALRVDRLAVKYRDLLPSDQTFDDEATLLRAACGNQLTEGVTYSIEYMTAMADVAFRNRADAVDDANNAPIQPRETEGDGERGDFMTIAEIGRL